MGSVVRVDAAEVAGHVDKGRIEGFHLPALDTLDRDPEVSASVTLPRRLGVVSETLAYHLQVSGALRVSLG